MFDTNCYGSKQPVLANKMRISNDVVELRQWSSYLVAWENSRLFTLAPPAEETSEQRTKKFHTDDVASTGVAVWDCHRAEYNHPVRMLETGLQSQHAPERAEIFIVLKLYLTSSKLIRLSWVFTLFNYFQKSTFLLEIHDCLKEALTSLFLVFIRARVAIIKVELLEPFIRKFMLMFMLHVTCPYLYQVN